MRVLNTAYEYVRSESVFGFKLHIITLVYVSYVIISTIFSCTTHCIVDAKYSKTSYNAYIYTDTMTYVTLI